MSDSSATSEGIFVHLICETLEITNNFAVILGNEL